MQGLYAARSEVWRNAMRSKLVTSLLVFVGLFASVPLFAHHGNASYNYDKKVTVSGTVTQWIWANPHSWLKFDAKDGAGGVTHWIIESGNPVDMARQGWAHDSFKPGDEVTVTVIQAKNSQPIGRFVGKDSIVLNGKPFPPSGSDNSGTARTASKP